MLAVSKRYDYCQKCGTFRKVLHRDHIVPKWRWKLEEREGDVDDTSNIQYLCANCHEDKTLEESDSEEWKTRQSAIMHSPEVSQKLSKASVGNQYAKGYRHTEEAKRAISEAGASRQPISEETRRKRSESNKKDWERRRSGTSLSRAEQELAKNIRKLELALGIEGEDDASR